MKMLHRSTVLLAVAVMSLVGCGGGGGGLSTPVATTASATITPMKGQFCAGTIINVKDVNNTLVGSGTVDATGKATLSIPTKAAAPFVVEVATGASASCYFDEVTNTPNVPLAAGTVALHGVYATLADLTSATGIAVTPMTDLAYQALNTNKALGNAASINTANQSVATLYGLTLKQLLAPPTVIGSAAPNLATTAGADDYALKIAALSKLAAASKLAGEDTMRALMRLSAQYANTGLLAADVTAFRTAYQSFTSGATSMLGKGVAAPALPTIQVGAITINGTVNGATIGTGATTGAAGTWNLAITGNATVMGISQPINIALSGLPAAPNAAAVQTAVNQSYGAMGIGAVTITSTLNTPTHQAFTVQFSGVVAGITTSYNLTYDYLQVAGGAVAGVPATGGATTAGLSLSPLAGAVGTQVTISGLSATQYAAYQPGQIKFGAAAGTGYSFNVVGTSYNVSASVPAGLAPGVYTVTYVSAAGTQPALTAGTFTVQ